MDEDIEDNGRARAAFERGAMTAVELWGLGIAVLVIGMLLLAALPPMPTLDASRALPIAAVAGLCAGAVASSRRAGAAGLLGFATANAIGFALLAAFAP